MSCPKCNGRGAKGNIFTINSVYKKKGTSLDSIHSSFDRTHCYANKNPLLAEAPDLLHPEIDDSFEYLKFNEFGEIQPKLDRGQKTIEICKLNRNPLVIARYQVIKSFQNSFLEVVEFHKKGLIRNISETENFFQLKCKILKNRYKRSLPYTLLARYMNDNFEDFFVKKIPLEYQQFLKKCLQFDIV